MLNRLRDKLAKWLSPEPREVAPPVTVTYSRLSRDDVQALRRTLPSSALTNQTTELQAAYQLGIQHTLNVLSEGWEV